MGSRGSGWRSARLAARYTCAVSSATVCQSKSAVSRCRAALRPALGGRRIVEHRDDRLGQPRHIARRARHPGLTVDHCLAQAADVRRHQRGARGRGFQRRQPERFVVAGQHRGVGAMQRGQQIVVIQSPDEVSCLEYLVFTGLLDEPVLLGAFAGDGQGGAGVGPPDPWQRGDRLVHALLVLQPAHV